ncbi:nuclear pore complex protein Nup160 [Hypomesus transpacificus]|uniref:nuclear pore complex protein Nup160 n=1 Tax=Hypomesus transpacificus TaxID=137520 RepID=UPI001F087888|nr:nuclear pore complex protein Nup160 [Hypomesus transpacificus]
MAAVMERSFIEICGFERETLPRFREITINLGLNALPGGVKYPDTAGGFHYEDSGKLLSVTSNRFIHWSTSGDSVQLVEQSLDTNLLNNSVRLKFPHCPLLPGGVHIQETVNNVIILIVTNQTVHRLVLLHPTRMYRSELVSEQMQSIFTDMGKLSLQDPAHSAVIPSGVAGGGAGHAATPSTSAAWLGQQGEAHYALAMPTGGIMIVTLPSADSQDAVSVLELKRSSVMQRLAGWMPSAIRGDQSPGDLALSLAARELEDDTFIFALCHDNKLRMWSYRDQTCVMEADMLEYVPAGADVHRLAGQSHRLRLSFSPATGLCLAVYLAAPSHSQFTVLQLAAGYNNRYGLDHISTLFDTQETLVDFMLTPSDIWALWLDESNQTVVKLISYEHSERSQWNQVFVQPLPEDEVSIGVDQDPRETYLDVLFSPLRFTASAIVKALQIYKRASERTVDLSWDALKKEVTIAVEDELQSSVTEFEFSQEEYRLLQVEFWSKFYACCLQYQEALSTPLGLMVNTQTSMVCLLKKGLVSFLLPCFAVDHLYLYCDEYLSSEVETPLTEDPELARDVLQLVQCLRLVSEAVPGDVAYEMERALDQLEAPENTAEQVLDHLLDHDNEDVVENIQSKLQDIRSPLAAMGLLLRELDLETDPEANPDPPLTAGQSLNVRISLSQLYGSSVMVSVVCQALSHTAMTRALCCRDLLLLQHLYLRLDDNVFLAGGAQLLQLQQDLIPRTSHLLSSYLLLQHTCQSLACALPLDIIDANLQHLSVLEMSDSLSLATNRSVLSPQTVLELFYQGVARKSIISQLYSQQQGPTAGLAMLHWPHMVSSVVQLLAQQLWPSNPGFQFPECLMANCQYTQLQEYIRLIQPWCQVNMGSCSFMLGQCYLANGEGQKALECFKKASPEVEKEEFLLRVAGADEEEAASSPLLQYYNKVLRLLEDVGLPELVIQLASLAITVSTTDLRSQAALWTRIFKHHLDLGHNSEAYEALVQNPDSSRQLDCLRQLVVVLCERSQLQDLVRFSYINLHDEVVSIIESRARAVDLMTHNYYELLYAFHTNRHNFRKAGTVMFEYGMRLGREVRTRQGLQKQVNCYLAALNCLRLMKPAYAWIVQPTSGAVYERPGASPKRNYDGEFATGPVSRQIDILELKDLEREYILARSRLTLAEQDSPSTAIAGSASAVEMVSLLVQTGLFDCALSLCQTFKLPLTSVFEGLAFKCIKLQYGGDESQNEAWNWLAANQLSTVITTKESSATDEAWRLLASYLERYPTQNALHHHCVINKLLSHGVPLPDWLVNAYKGVDTAALLRLYLNFDLLDAAAELVLEYVDALLGKGHQYFGIERPLSATAPLVWLPYTSIDQLLQSLNETQTNANIYNRLRDKLDDYHKLVDQTSRRRLQAQ